jgi:hypothetical protein
MSAGPLLIGGALDFTTPPQNVRVLSLAGSANRPTGRAKPRQLRVLRPQRRPRARPTGVAGAAAAASTVTGDAHSLSVTDRTTRRQAEARATTGCGLDGSEQATQVATVRRRPSSSTVPQLPGQCM